MILSAKGDRWERLQGLNCFNDRASRSNTTFPLPPICTPATQATSVAAILHFNFIPRLRPAIFRIRVRHFEKSCDKIAQPDWLTLVAIRSDERKRDYERERAHLANAGEFNRRYLTCQISAILYADQDDRRIKSPGVSPA